MILIRAVFRATCVSMVELAKPLEDKAGGQGGFYTWPGVDDTLVDNMLEVRASHERAGVTNSWYIRRYRWQGRKVGEPHHFVPTPSVGLTGLFWSVGAGHERKIGKVTRSESATYSAH